LNHLIAQQSAGDIHTTLIRLDMARQFLILISIILFGTGIGADAQTPVPIWTSNGANKIQQLVESGTTDLITSGTITPWGLAIDATSD
jgi:hypothetical protein